MLNIFWNLIAFLVSIGLLITVHEFGHFWVARRYGVTVERFSIGFGTSLWRHIDRHGTELVISLIPLGGYVKMSDKCLETTSPSVAHCTFHNKKVIERAAVIVAGPFANFIFAIFSYWIVFIIGVPGFRPVVEGVDNNSMAAYAQIVPGMEFKAIDGIYTPDWDAVRLQLIKKIGKSHVNVSLLPFGSTTDEWQERELDLKDWSFKPYKEDPIISLGIHPKISQIETVLAEVQDFSAAKKAGLQVGDRILKVNGQLLTEWITFSNLVSENPGKPLELEIMRKGSHFSVKLIPEIKLEEDGIKGFAGVAPKVIPLPDEYKIIRLYGPFNALYQAIKKTCQLVQLMFSMLGKLVSGDVRLNSLSGPIGIAKLARISAESGGIHYLMFLSILSINLGIMNLLPIPILDGGGLFFLMIEKLKGSPVSKKIQDVSYQIGLIILLALVGIALFNDLFRLLEN